MTILDAHCDAPSQMLRQRDYTIDNPGVQVDFPKMVKGGVDASFFALYIPAELDEAKAREHAFAMLEAMDAQVARASDVVAYARNASEVAANKAKGLVSILIGLENASPIGHDIGVLEELAARGVRYVTLTHSADNQICDSCTGKGRWGGLSPFGREFVRELNRLNVLVDVAHCADSTVREVLEVSEKPVVYTHGCCRALHSHPRNLPDELLKGIAQRGGVVGMSIYPDFLSDSGSPGVGKVVDHIEHAIDVCGIDHVGLGTDYDGIDYTAQGLEDISKFRLILDVLHGRGYTQAEVSKVAGENFLNLL